MKKTFLFIISCLLLCNCNIGAQGNFSDIKNNYHDILSLYPSKLISYLPSKLNQDKLAFYEFEFPRGRYLNFIHLVAIYSDKEISKITSSIKPLKVYNFNDNRDLLIVEYDPLIYIDTLFTLKKINPALNELPIPNFSFLKDIVLPSSFYCNAKIYVLDAKQGKFLKDDYLSQDGVGLPNEWQHGYTTGIVISGNIVVYWLEVW